MPRAFPGDDRAKPVGPAYPPLQVGPVTAQDVASGLLLFGLLVMWVAAAISMTYEHLPDLAGEAILPIVLALGTVWTLARLRIGGTAWLLPALTFLLAWSIVGVAWADHAEDPAAEEDCDQDGFLPARVEPAMLAWTWVAAAAGAVSLLAGAALCVSPATRWAGIWCLLAAGTVAVGGYSVSTRCM